MLFRCIIILSGVIVVGGGGVGVGGDIAVDDHAGSAGIGAGGI